MLIMADHFKIILRLKRSMQRSFNYLTVTKGVPRKVTLIVTFLQQDLKDTLEGITRMIWLDI